MTVLPDARSREKSGAFETAGGLEASVDIYSACVNMQ
jgi:hypothetical protein